MKLRRCISDLSCHRPSSTTMQPRSCISCHRPSPTLQLRRCSSRRSFGWLECHLLSLLLLRIAASNALPPSFQNGEGVAASYKSTYSRSDEVQRHCKHYLTNLSVDDSNLRQNVESRKWAISNQLTFLNGDWQQDAAGKAPLMPFIRVLSGSPDGLIETETAHLASLWITDVDLQNRQSSMVNVSAMLQLGLSSERGLYYPTGSSMEGSFQVSPGFSLMTILMEGVYAELEGGDKLVCMVGSSRLPSRGKNASFPWDWLDSTGKGAIFSPPVSDDSKIIAVFRFPALLSLTSRKISGRFESFRATSDPSFFDPVEIFSQMGAYSSYQFVSGDLVNSACAKPGLSPGELSPPQKFYRGTAFCALIQELLTGQSIDVLPNWNCTLSEDICTKLGPFLHDSPSSKFMDGGFNHTQLLVQDIRCVDYLEDDGSSSANMSAVFRAVLPSQSKSLASALTALDGLTLAAEGKWSNLSGQLCMIGCRGGGKTGKNKGCDTKICIYVPLFMSLNQRSLFQGSISSIHNTSDYYPLSFRYLGMPWNSLHVVKNLTYEYTKISQAEAFLERSDSAGLGERIKKSLLQYPSVKGGLGVLFRDLSFHSLAITNPNSLKGPHLKQSVTFDMIAIDKYVALDSTYHESDEISYIAPTNAIDDEIEKEEEQKKYYKVAADLKIEDRLGNRIITVSAEGGYDPTIGMMFLVGCRQVNPPWKTFQESIQPVEDGMDCLTELKMEYPPTNARWLMNPTVMLTVTSKRPEDDPLFFAPMELETFPILYKRQREDIVSRKSLEGGLSIITFSLILGCIISQLIYLKSHANSTPYISLLMLAVQAVGFSIPLITGVEAFFARITSHDTDMKETVLSEGKAAKVIGYMVKLLTLAAFLLTLRIIQKVYKSRIRLSTRRPHQPGRVPSDKRVLGIFSAIHILGFLTVLIIHSIRIRQRPINSSIYMDWSGSLHKQYDWEMILREYYGLVQDLFLLPQVVGNHVWQVKGKPLRMLFYIGVTVLRLLPHVYDGLRSPVSNPYFADEFEYANPTSDFYSKAGDIAIPVIAVLLALVVYIQQRWNGLKWEKVLRQGSSKLMRMGSKMYERLPSKTFEAEMVEAATAQGPPENGHLAVSSER